MDPLHSSRCPGRECTGHRISPRIISRASHPGRIQPGKYGRHRRPWQAHGSGCAHSLSPEVLPRRPRRVPRRNREKVSSSWHRSCSYHSRTRAGENPSAGTKVGGTRSTRNSSAKTFFLRDLSVPVFLTASAAPRRHRSALNPRPRRAGTVRAPQVRRFFPRAASESGGACSLAQPPAWQGPSRSGRGR